MKKFKFICALVLVLLSFSCTKEDSKNEKSLTVDYKLDLGFFKDLTINTDGNAYILRTKSDGIEEKFQIQKITPAGKTTLLYNQSSYYYQDTNITNDLSGKIYWTSNNLLGNIYSFSNNQLAEISYTMQGTEQFNIRMDEFGNLNNDQFVVYDGGLRKFKLYSKSQNTDFVIAGSENYAVVDGIGANAGFLWIQRINTLDNNIYALDSQQYIRKIDCNTSAYNVSTVYNLNYETILDFAVDSNHDIYAILRFKGIYKLSGGSYSVFKNGTEKGKTLNGGKSFSIDWTQFNRIFIKDNDMYLVSGYGTLTKISNFKEKL